MTTSDPWRSRIVRSGVADPKTLNANPRNWRTHPPEQRRALTEMLDTVGYVQQVVVNRTTGNLVDGHLRVELAVERGEKRIPVVYVELTEDEEARVLAALDPLASMAGVDTERLDSLLREMTLDDGSLSRMLADMARASKIDLWPKEPRWKSDPDDAPQRRKTDAKVGDLWALGDHRLLCGDSTDPEVIGRLMEPVGTAQMVWTDPPYGVAVASRIGTEARTSAEAKARGRRGIDNDEMDVEALTGFLRRSVGAVLPHTDAGAAWYVAAPHGPMGTAFSIVLNETGIWHESLVWVKDSLVLSRLDYHYRHEVLYYGWTPGGAHHAPPTRDQDTLWEFPRPKRSAEHPTMKPVALIERALHNSSDAGAVVLEPFCGSGSTLIACERTARRCMAVELDPEFLQVTIDRWERHTGETAARLQ